MTEKKKSDGVKTKGQIAVDPSVETMEKVNLWKQLDDYRKIAVELAKINRYTYDQLGVIINNIKADRQIAVGMNIQNLYDSLGKNIPSIDKLIEVVKRSE